MNHTNISDKTLNAIKKVIKVFLILLAGVLPGCSGGISNYTMVEKEPQIYPDYSGLTIPPNIAPLNFIISEKADKYLVKIHSADGEQLNINSRDGIIRISQGKWQKLLKRSKGQDLSLDIFMKQEGTWKKFQTISNHVATDSIDKYLVYRLFDQGFVIWNRMGIYQRCLENFNETPVIINNISEGNCVNCHSFSRNNSETMLFHMRQKVPGTIIYRKGKVWKIDTKTGKTTSPGVYPAWNPDGRHVAFSVNQILQVFLAVPDQMREAVDTVSDLILYDTETNLVSNCSEIARKDRLETFPAWSPDGRYLYYCSAKSLPPGRFKELKYDLLRIAYDPVTSLFGKVDTIVSSSHLGLSVSLPRISPDGKYLLFCMASFGSFHIWHVDSDLYLMNLETGEISKPGINSNLSESYHSWSSKGRWIVFSSKREDGFTTELFIAYFDVNGKAHKPFILPQRDPAFYKTFLRTYNIPEFVTSAVKLNPRNLTEILKSKPIGAYTGDIK